MIKSHIKKTWLLPTMAFVVLFMPKAASAQESLADFENLRDNLWTAEAQVQGVSERAKLTFMKRRKTVYGVWYNEESHSPRGFYTHATCFKGEVSGNRIINSSVIQIQRDANTHRDTYPDFVSKYPRFEDVQVKYATPFRDAFLKSCIFVYEELLTKPCPPPDPYRLSFVGRRAGGGSTFGHAFVIWEKYNPARKDYDLQAFGFYPARKGLAAFGSFDPKTSGVAGAIKDENTQSGILGQNILRIAVSEQTFMRTLALKDRWEMQAKSGETDYELLEKNCVVFVDEVVKNVGDKPVPGQPENNSNKALVAPSRSQYKFPAIYIEDLIKLNARRNVSTAPCQPKK